MERETGIEPATSSLGSWRSTAELLPLDSRKITTFGVGEQYQPRGGTAMVQFSARYRELTPDSIRAVFPCQVSSGMLSSMLSGMLTRRIQHRSSR